jgi:hypothetical protein
MYIVIIYGTHNYDQVNYIKHISKIKMWSFLNKDEEALQSFGM